MQWSCCSYWNSSSLCDWSSRLFQSHSDLFPLAVLLQNRLVFAQHFYTHHRAWLNVNCTMQCTCVRASVFARLFEFSSFNLSPVGEARCVFRCTRNHWWRMRFLPLSITDPAPPHRGRPLSAGRRGKGRGPLCTSWRVDGRVEDEMGAWIEMRKKKHTIWRRVHKNIKNTGWSLGSGTKSV